MIVEQHYDEEVLIGLLEEDDHDSHVPSCQTCAGTLESFRDLTGALRDNSVWDDRPLSETPAPQTTNMIRAFAARTRAEDDAARPIVAKLVAASAEERTALLAQNPGWRTAGVVRGLLAHVDTINYSEPKVAADIAASAVDVAESLDPDNYPLATITKLRASAWHERGYTLYYIGRYSESLDAFDRTDDLLLRCSVSEFESANVGLHRAQVYGDLEDIDRALALTERVRDIFRKYGAARREAAADGTTATLLMRVRRFAEALAIHERLAENREIDEVSRAQAFHNAAICLRELSRLEDAKRMFAQAVSEFGRLRLFSMRTRSRWLLARILLAEKSYESALPLFREISNEFADCGLFHEVALVSVDVAETLLMLERSREVVSSCQSAIAYFAKAGLAYTQGALTALAYLKEAAESETLTLVALGHIRGYFENLPKQPDLLFAHPA